jgi:hypothetical protein
VYELDLDLTLILADFAQVADGKLYISGGGWTFTSAPSGPMAIAVLAQVPWNEANHPYDLRVELLGDDGAPARLGDEGAEMHIAGQLEAGRPPGHPLGAPLVVPIAINVLPMPLEPGRRYEWRVTVDGETRDDWRLPFSTRPA